MRILIAEDSGIRAQLVEAFTDLGDPRIEVVSVRSGFGWKELIDRGEYFDAVIADIIMPVESEGLDFHHTGIRLVRSQLEKGLVGFVIMLSVRVPELREDIAELDRQHNNVHVIGKNKGGYPAPESIVQIVLAELSPSNED